MFQESGQMNRNLYFVSRVAFLYNICMLATISMKYYQLIPEGAMKSTVIISGLIMSVIFNAIVMCWIAVRIFSGKKSQLHVPLWLILVNLIFFIFQLYLVLK